MSKETETKAAETTDTSPVESEVSEDVTVPETEGKTSLITEAQEAETDDEQKEIGEGPEETSDEKEKDDEGEEKSDDETPELLTIESFVVPEGIEIDEAQFSSALEIINNPDLSSVEVGKKLIDLQIKMTQEAMGAAEEAGNAAWDEMQTQWQEEAKALPKIGGDALPATLTAIKAGLKRAGATKKTFEALALTGAGNNPEIIKVLHALTKPLTEGGPVQGSTVTPKLSRAERIYKT